MARVALLCPDLLFGSKLQGALRAAGHEPVAPGEDADVLVVDLTDDVDARIAQAADAGIPRLAFYSHVEQDVRRRADQLHAVGGRRVRVDHDDAVLGGRERGQDQQEELGGEPSPKPAGRTFHASPSADFSIPSRRIRR